MTRASPKVTSRRRQYLEAKIGKRASQQRLLDLTQTGRLAGAYFGYFVRVRCYLMVAFDAHRLPSLASGDVLSGAIVFGPVRRRLIGNLCGRVCHCTVPTRIDAGVVGVLLAEDQGGAQGARARDGLRIRENPFVLATKGERKG